MTIQHFRDALSAQPFLPFRLTMSSGESFEVRHPEMAFLTRNTISIGMDVADDGIPDRMRTLSLLHVTAMEPIETAPTEN